MITKSQRPERVKKETSRRDETFTPKPYRWVKINTDQRREIVHALGLLYRACDYAGANDKAEYIRKLSCLFAEENWLEQFKNDVPPYVRVPKDNVKTN